MASRLAILRRLIRNYGLAGGFSEAWRYRNRTEGATVSALLRAQQTVPVPASTASPVLTVVVPVYDTDPDLLAETVQSVRRQSWQRWELLLVDDASSSPETIAAVDRAESVDDRVRVVRLPSNRGIAGATNAGIEVATGSHVLFLDHDDILLPDALAWVAAVAEADLIYTDEAKVRADGSLDTPLVKPSWSPRLLLARNYVNHATAVRTEMLRAVGGIRSGFEGAQDHDLLLRLAEHDPVVAHVPLILYLWRATEGSTAADETSKREAETAGRRAVQEALDRRGWPATASGGRGVPFVHGVTWDRWPDSVKAVIPTRDKPELLASVLDDLMARTEPTSHVVVVDNGSVESETHAILDAQRAHGGDVVRIDEEFNYSRLCNAGAATGPDTEFLLFLNNDVTVSDPRWLRQMLGWFIDPSVVAVGTELLYPDGTIQHAGVWVGGHGLAGHVGRGSTNEPRTGDWHDVAHEVSAVTAAAMVVRTSAFQAVGGFDEQLPVDYQDVDLCLRLGQIGTIMYEPRFPLTHVESASRGLEGAGSRYTLARLDFKWRERLRQYDPFVPPAAAIPRTDRIRLPGLYLEERVKAAAPRWSGKTQ